MTNFGMGVPLMRTHASMQMERLQDGLAEVSSPVRNVPFLTPLEVSLFF